MCVFIFTCKLELDLPPSNYKNKEIKSSNFGGQRLELEIILSFYSKAVRGNSSSSDLLSLQVGLEAEHVERCPQHSLLLWLNLTILLFDKMKQVCFFPSINSASVYY